MGTTYLNNTWLQAFYAYYDKYVKHNNNTIRLLCIDDEECPRTYYPSYDSTHQRNVSYKNNIDAEMIADDL